MTQPAPHSFAAPTRPQVVTVIGVMSIVVAVLGIGGVLVSGFFYVGIVRQVGQMAANKARSVTAAASGGGKTATSIGVGLPTPDALAAELDQERQLLVKRRDALVNVLGGLHELSADQQRQLARLLGQHADRFVPASLFENGVFSPADAQAWVRQAGDLTAGGSTGATPAYYQVPAGKIEVSDDRAVFRPAAGGDNLRVGGQGDPGIEGLRFTLAAGNAAVPATQPAKRVYRSGLNDVEIDGIVSQAQSLLSASALPAVSTTATASSAATQPADVMTPTQVAGLRSALQTSPPLVTSQTAYAAVRMALAQPDGSVFLRLSNGSLQIGPTGAILDRSSDAVNELALDPMLGVLMIGELIASAGLTALLMTAGIQLLRNSPWAGGMHWIYALAKLPVAVTAAATFAWLVSDFSAGVARLNGGQGSATAGGTAFGLTMAGLAAVYPVVLLVLLRTRTVREYLAATRTP